MKKIRVIDLSRLRNNEHAQFHQSIKVEIDIVTAAKLGIIKFYPAYIAALDAEFKAIDIEQGSKYTKTITEADVYRDQLYKSFVLALKAGKLSFDAEVQTACNNILRIVEQVGDMRKQNYNQESETLKSLITQLKTNYATDITKSKCTEILDKLEESNNQFIEHFGVRAQDVALRTSGDVSLTRKPLDEIYHNIVDVINSLVLLNGDDDYSTFIDKVNYLVDYNNTMVNMRKSTNKSKKDSVVNTNTNTETNITNDADKEVESPTA
jgi:hypothetical protein